MRYKCEECCRVFSDEPECNSCPNCGSGCVDEIDKVKFKTKPIDYTGCDPVIAEHLKRGEKIWCNCVAHSIAKNCYIRDYEVDGGKQKYIADCEYYEFATPIQQTQYVKKASEIVKWLEDNGWKFYNATNHAYWYTHDTIGGDCKFFASMFAFCGDEKPGCNSWLQEWLEYR